MDFTIFKTLRKGRRTTLRDMAKSLNISVSYLSMIERNKRIPHLDIIEDLCRELDCELIIKVN